MVLVLFGWSVAANEIRLGLDLQGGIGVVLTAPQGAGRDVVDKAIDIIRNRVDALGVGEPDITRQGERNIQVQLPGVRDREAAIRIVGTTAQLQFRPVLEVLGPPGTPTTPVTPTASATETATPTVNATTPTAGAATETASTTATPTTPAATTETATPTVEGVTPPEEDTPEKEVVLLTKDEPKVRYRLGAAEVIGSDVKTATAEQEQSNTQSGVVFGGWQVRLVFTGAGEAKFKKVTGQLACFPQNDPKRQFAIVLDHVIQSAPRVADSVQCNEGIAGGGVITIGSGGDQRKEAQELSTVLRFGALPAPFERSNVQEVSATLGRESLRAGLLAGLVGLAIVALYAILYYRALGVVVVAGLGVFAALLYAVVAILSEYSGLTLSLAGIAGVIVSVGITADSYIVYFERIKEEVRRGRTVRSAVDSGFQRAFRTIYTADFVTLGAAAVLYVVAVSSVKGFALLLGIATILDVTIAWFFTRNIVALLLPTHWFAEGRFIGLSHIALGGEAAS